RILGSNLDRVGKESNPDNDMTANEDTIQKTDNFVPVAVLHKHLWDYFIVESDTKAICKKCDLTIKYHTITDFKKHLKRYHKLVDNESNSDNDMIANEDITPKIDNFIRVRHWIRFWVQVVKYDLRF
ncbi:hypothetical protein ALC56_06416, partial [Trachymyrmex septentrionalis]